MHRVSVILPLRGRVQRTTALLPRLWATAGYGNWELLLVADDDAEVANAVQRLLPRPGVTLIEQCPRGGYWRACQLAMQRASGTLLIALANDLLPCRDWLLTGVQAYTRRFGDGEGLLGANDGIHKGSHAAHFLIHRRMLERYGGWPVWYEHGYGDTELCQRAQAEQKFAIAPFFVLFHDHPIIGGQWDQVYSEGSAASDSADRARYDARARAGWPAP
jgi:hypothetical protein